MRQTAYLTIAAFLFGSLACGEAGGPDLHGPPFFSVTLDGARWLPDTALSIVYASPCDTIAFISAVREVSSQESEEVIVILRAFPTAGQLTLSDTSTTAAAAFTVSRMSGGFLTPTVSYWTGPATPGLLTVLGTTRDDSLISGRFAFEAATVPDSGVHRRLTGQFRVRYSVEPVYTVPGC